jgi:ferredoxin
MGEDRGRIGRRGFLVGSAAGVVTLAAGISPAGCSKPLVPGEPQRTIDPARCIGCGECVGLCPMGAIRWIDGTSSIDPDACAECGVCSRSRICPVEAIRPGTLRWPRTLRETFSNPLVVHKDTGVRGRGSEGIKTNDSTGRYPAGSVGVFIELGRPARGTRFVDVERVLKKFNGRGYPLAAESPVAGLIADPATGALQPEILQEKAISVLVEFILPETAVPELEAMLEELAGEVETVFSVSIALRAGPDGTSPFDRLFGRDVFRLPNGKVNLGLAQGIARKGA